MDTIRDENGKTLSEFLAEYDASAYEHPSVTVDMAVFTAKQTNDGIKMAVLLIKRRNHPSIGKHAMPGGFVEMDEPIYLAAQRELLEETSVTGIAFRQFGTFGDVDRDPRTRVISVGHYAVVPMDSLKICAGDDAQEAELFTFCVKRIAPNEYEVMLSGSCELSFTAILKHDGMGYIIDSVKNCMLASDHDKMLFAAFCALVNHKKEDIASLLISDKLNKKEALSVVEEALGQLPWCSNIGI